MNGFGYGQIAGGLGETLFGLLGGFGSKPKVAQFKPIDYTKEQAGAIAGNIQNFGALSALGADYTKYTTDALNKLIPGYSDLLSKGGADTSKLLDVAGQFLSGDLPPDVIAQIGRADAYGAMSGGFAGSQMAHNLTARDLGLTSIDLMKTGAGMLGQGGNSAQQWQALASQSIYDPQKMFVTPQQKSTFDLQNALLKLGTLQNKYNVQAAPDPMMAGLMAISGQFAGGSLGMGGFGQPASPDYGYGQPGGAGGYGSNEYGGYA